MRSFRPTVEQERWIAAASRSGAGRGKPWLGERIGGWRAVGTFTRGALFALGVAAAGLAVAIVSLLHVPGPYLVAGVAAVAVAEWLVGQGGFFGAGIEEALEVVGLLLIAFELVSGSGTAFETRLSLAIAAALLAAGLRFLNPLLTTLAAAVLSFAISLVVSTSGPTTVPRGMIPGLCCFAAAAAALGLGAFRVRRPSHDQMLDWLVVAMPLAGYLWLGSSSLTGTSAEPRPHAALAAMLSLGMPMLFAATSLVVGVRRRSHAPLLAAMACVGCIAYELRRLSGLPLEVRLIVWGSAGLVGALLLDRYLRTPRAGITSRRVGEGEDAFGLLQLVGAAALTPPSAQPPEAQFNGGGGRFDGGGASGRY
jgi:hypothetical protein